MGLGEGAWVAAAWGAIAGSALLLGALLALVMPVQLRIVGAVMGFGAGVLISAVAFELTVEHPRVCTTRSQNHRPDDCCVSA